MLMPPTDGRVMARREVILAGLRAVLPADAVVSDAHELRTRHLNVPGKPV